MLGRLHAREDAPQRGRLEDARPQPAQLAGRAREGDRQPAVVLEEHGRRRAGEPERRRRPSGIDACLRTPGAKSAYGPAEALRDPARDPLDLAASPSSTTSSRPATRASVSTVRSSWVGPSPPEKTQTSASIPSRTRCLELVRIVADDEHPGRLEAERRELAGEEGAVGVGLVSPHELAAREDDDRSRASAQEPVGERADALGA